MTTSSGIESRRRGYLNYLDGDLASADDAAAARPAPGKVTLTSRLAGPGWPRTGAGEGAVQRQAAASPPTAGPRASGPVDDPFGLHLLAAPGADAPEAVQAQAARGVDGAGCALPHLDVLQAAFGHHDLGGVRAHVGGAAAEAAHAIGATAYATGAAVGFGSAPDLHTAAHEAAHVVQQRAGVSLAGGVGQADDRYERHADAVADAVVRGAPVEALLDHGPGGAAAEVGPAVQRKGGLGLGAMVTGAVPPAARFPHADEAEQRQILRSTPPAQRAALLERIGAGAARALLFAVVLPAQERLTAIKDLPGVARILDFKQAWSLLERVHLPPGAQRRLFAQLPNQVRLQLLPALSARLQADVYPAYNGATPAEHAALLSTVSDAELDGIFAGRSPDELQVMLETVPRHVATRIAAAVQASQPLVALPAERAADGADAAAEAGSPRPVRRPTRAQPAPEAWAALPRDERVDWFRTASTATRVRYLRADHESKLAMLRELQGGAFVETLAAYVAQGGGRSVLSMVTPAELLGSILADPDPVAVAHLVPHLTGGQRAAVLPALSPGPIAALLADPKADRAAAWLMVHSGVPDETIRAALRTLTDDQLLDLDGALAPAAAATLRALVPAARRAALPPADDAA